MSTAELIRAMAKIENARAAFAEAAARTQRDLDEAFSVIAALAASDADAGMIGVKAAARLAGVSPRTIVRRAKDSGIGEQVGNAWRFKPDLVKAFFRPPSC